MSTIKGFKIGIVAVLLTFTLSCDKDRFKPKYPIEPEIAFVSWVQTTGSFDVLTIEFTDGDGDIGLDDDQTAPPFNDGSTYYHNLFFDYYGYQGGSWIKIEPLAPYYYRIPNLTPDSQNKSLKGEISVDILKPFDEDSDSVKFEIKLVDRDLNESNVIESIAIVNPSKI